MSRATPHEQSATAVLIPVSLSASRWVVWGTVGLVCLMLGAFLELPETIEVPGPDTGLFATYGAMLLHGARPYLDFWDLHPPLVFAYWALVQAVTGTDWLRTCISIDILAPQSCTGLTAHGLDLVLSVSAALVVAAITRRCGGSDATAAFAALLVVGFADQAMLSQEGSNPSKLTLLPSSLAVWAYSGSLGDRQGWRGALIAGAAAAVAGLAKQPALLTLVALAGHSAWRHDGTRLAALLVGAAATFAAACAILAADGSLVGFLDQAWTYNLERVLVGYFVHPAKPPVISLDRVLAESAGALAALGIIGAFVVGRAPLRSAQGVVVCWAAVNVIAVTAFREFVYVVPSLAVIGALGLERILGWSALPRRPLMRVLLVAGFLACLMLTTSFQRVQLARARFERASGSGLAQTEELGMIFRRDLPPGPLFIYGNGAQMYALADRTPATRFLNAEALRASAPHVETTRADLVAELKSRPPSIIALAPHSDEAELTLADYASMRSFLQDCYALRPISPDIDASWSILVRTGVCGLG